jgi:REP-associated tyrosine transposase
MPRPPRVDVGGYAYHVLNRTAGRWRMFRKDGDFEAFERVLEQAVERSGGDVRLLTYCLMANH